MKITREFLHQLKRAAPSVKTYRSLGRFSIGDIVRIGDPEAREEFEVEEEDLFVVLDVADINGIANYGLFHLKDEDQSAWHEEKTLILEMTNEDAVNYAV